MGADMSRRKSAVKMFGNLTSEGVDSSKPDNGSEPPAPKRKTASSVTAAARTMSSIRDEREQLLKTVADAQGVLSLQADMIDPSPVADRLPDDNDDAFQKLKATLEAEGQKVPILVRPHPTKAKRYQIVYGHRRTRALRELGRPVAAQVSDYSDRDLLVAQGIENGNRQDLTWIEKALFAARMAAEGLKPRDIIASLSVDHSELSKYRKVTTTLPADILEGIGRAPKAGRPRWLEITAAVTADGDLERLRSTLTSEDVRRLPSDERFARGLASLEKSEAPAAKRGQRQERKLGSVGTASFGKSDVKIALNAAHSEAFKAFLERELSSLVERYEKESGET